ncbi:hypothetical protein ACQP2K_16670 [Microbispora siamensis]
MTARAGRPGRAAQAASPVPQDFEFGGFECIVCENRWWAKCGNRFDYRGITLPETPPAVRK